MNDDTVNALNELFTDHSETSRPISKPSLIVVKKSLLYQYKFQLVRTLRPGDYEHEQCK